LQQLAKFFGMTVDKILNFEGELPPEVSVEGKPGFEQINMINQLDEKYKQTVFKNY
jgi:maltooligosyltrehalose synthase